MFPPNLALDYLYPEVSVTYAQDYGSFLDVACFTPGLAEVQKVIYPLANAGPTAGCWSFKLLVSCIILAFAFAIA